ncbi:MAG: YggT family protein [Chloroflexota bacterium]
MIVIVYLVYALQIYSFILLARVLMTWIPNLDYNNPIVKFLIQATEPVLQPVRNMLPQNSGLDFSPIVVFLAITLISRVLLSL